MNTMMFCGRYFHITEGTATETVMKVNYHNYLIDHLKTNLLRVYKKLFKIELALWLIIIDDSIVVKIYRLCIYSVDWI